MAAAALPALDVSLRLNPRHPLANHLAVHAHEASSQPERGDAAANMLREIAPGLGHLVHMSSHIDVRRGRWEEAIVANTRAIATNRSYREQVGRPLSGYLNYMGHDYHMLTYAAMMSGQSALAAQTMRDLFAQMPSEWKRESDSGDGYFAMHFDVMKRFGQWDKILAEPEPIARYPHALAPGADWHAAAALASHERIAQAARALGFGRVGVVAPKPEALPKTT